MEWRTIETAPKDGSQILVVLGREMSVVEWDAAATEWNDGVGWRDMGDMGWGGMTGAEPTHWMPLPDPPA